MPDADLFADPPTPARPRRVPVERRTLTPVQQHQLITELLAIRDRIEKEQLSAGRVAQIVQPRLGFPIKETHVYLRCLELGIMQKKSPAPPPQPAAGEADRPTVRQEIDATRADVEGLVTQVLDLSRRLHALEAALGVA